MKVGKLTCIVYRDMSPALSAVLAAAGVIHSAVQSGRSVVLRERKRFLGLSTMTVLEDDPVDIYRVYVEPKSVDALLGHVVSKAGLDTPGRGSAFSEVVDIDVPAARFLNPRVRGGARGATRGSSLAADLVGICCIVQRGQAAPIIRSLLESGSVPTVTFGEGMGVRDKLGLLRIAIPAEKELVSAMVTRFDAEQIMRILIDVGRLDQPGKGFIYQYPIRRGVINAKTQRGRRSQGASMEQVVTAIDNLQGSTEWRKIEAVAGSRGNRRFLTDLANFSVLTNDGQGMGVVKAAMAVGAPGATLSRYRQLTLGEESPSMAREMSDIIVSRAMIVQLARTVRKAGLFSRETGGLVETAPVPLACTYLGRS